MTKNVDIDNISPELADDIIRNTSASLSDISFLKETSVSILYKVKTARTNILIKKYKATSYKKEFENHSTVYTVWRSHYQDNLFFIPQPLFFSSQNNYYAMEYVENNKNLIDLLYSLPTKDLTRLFRKLGRALFDYHRLMTDRLQMQKQPITSHDTISHLLNSDYQNKIAVTISSAPEESYRLLRKDFSPTNVLVSVDKIFFIDFQSIYYFAPFYYDLARFQDTLRIFGFLKNPFQYVWHRNSILAMIKSFFDAYSEKEPIDTHFLNSFSYLHKKEHLVMKRHNRIKSFILRFLYLINI